MSNASVWTSRKLAELLPDSVKPKPSEARRRRLTRSSSKILTMNTVSLLGLRTRQTMKRRT